MKYLNQSLALVLSFLIATPAFPQASVVNQQSQDVNYILNGGFENSKAGWVAYKDTAQAAPVTGSGVGPTTTISSSTSAPIQGKSSGILTKPASNTQGEGVSYAFKLDSAAKGRVLTISGLYQIISGTYSGGTQTTDSDVEVYIYDVDAAQVIQPAAYKLDGGVSGLNYTINATFQTNLTSTNYRLIFHEATVSASAYSLKLDQIKLGVGNKSQGPPVTDFIPGSCTSSWTTNTTLACQYKRDGSDAIIEWSLSLSNPPNAASLTFSAPAGLSFDTSKMPTYGASSYYIDGHANANGPAGFSFTIKPIFLAANSVNIYYQSDTAAHDSPVSQTNPVAWGTSMYITARIRVPIQGWSSGLTMSSDSGNRQALFRATGVPTGSLANATFNPATFPTAVTDTLGGYSAGVYTIKKTGYYDLYASVNLSGSYSNSNYGAAFLGFLINGSSISFYKYSQSTATSGQLQGTSLERAVYLTAGSTVQPTIEVPGWASVAYNGDTNAHTFSVTESTSNSQQIAASESVNARYTNAGGQSIPNGGIDTKVVGWAKDFDSNGSFSNDAYKISISGKYRVTFTANYASDTWSQGQGALASIYKNGALFAYGPVMTADTSTITAQKGVSVSTTVSCVSGDIIDFRISNSRTGATSLVASGSQNHFEIERIGN